MTHKAKYLYVFVAKDGTMYSHPTLSLEAAVTLSRSDQFTRKDALAGCVYDLVNMETTDFHFRVLPNA